MWPSAWWCHPVSLLRLRQSVRLVMLIVVIGRARSFRRNHKGSNGLFGRTFAAKEPTLMRFQHAFQNFAALRRFRIGHAHAGYGESLLGVPLRETGTDLERRLGNESET